MDVTKEQAWWAHRQGLDGAIAGKDAGEVLERTGWARSVGGVGPYMTLFSRAGLSREAVDHAVARTTVHELPSARGCTYVVPASHFALALRVGRGSGESAEMKTAQKLGVTVKEIDTLCKKLLDALGSGLKDPDELRKATAGVVRNLGEEGKKKGLTTTLPVALGRLQSEGEIRRVPINGRLDQQRYRYALWSPNPLAKIKMSPNEAQVELARLYFRWIAPASLSEFQWFSGLGVKASKGATAPLDLVVAPAANSERSQRLMFSDYLERFRAFQVPKKPSYTLVSSLDGVVLLRRDLGSLLAPQDRKRKVFVDNSSSPLGGLSDLPNHGILDRGRLVGLWEYDVARESVAWMAFIPKAKELVAAVSATEAFVREQLGDARSFSLDSPKSRAPRVDALRTKAG